MLHALLQQGTACLVVVLDSEYVYKGIVEWLLRWKRHGWRNSSGGWATEICGSKYYGCVNRWGIRYRSNG